MSGRQTKMPSQLNMIDDITIKSAINFLPNKEFPGTVNLSCQPQYSQQQKSKKGEG